MQAPRLSKEYKDFLAGGAPVFRCNALSMDVHVPAGAKEVVFKCTARKLGSALQAVGLWAALAAVALPVDRRRLQKATVKD
jgi:hypothetical protein